VENKVVSQKTEFIAQIKVTRDIRAVINPNGRDYKSDNVIRYLNDEVMEVTVKAGSAAKLMEKVSVVLGTIEEDA
jgi:hypothetical protein